MSKIGLNIGNVYNVISTSLTMSELEHSVLEPNKMIVSCETTDSGVDMSGAIIAGITDNDGKLNKMSINDPTIYTIGKVIAYSITNNNWPKYRFNDNVDVIKRSIEIDGETIVSEAVPINFAYSNCFSPSSLFDSFIEQNLTTTQAKGVTTAKLQLNVNPADTQYGTFNGKIEIFPNIYKNVELTINNIAGASVYLWTIPAFVDQANDYNTIFNNISKIVTLPKTEYNPGSSNTIGITELEDYTWDTYLAAAGYDKSIHLNYNSYYDIAMLLNNQYIDDAWGPTGFQLVGENYLKKLNESGISYSTAEMSLHSNNLYIGLNKNVINTSNISIGISYLPYIYDTTESEDEKLYDFIYMQNTYFPSSPGNAMWVKESLADVVSTIIEEYPGIKYTETFATYCIKHKILFRGITIHSDENEDSITFSSSGVTPMSIIYDLLENSYLSPVGRTTDKKITYFIKNFYGPSYITANYINQETLSLKELQLVGSNFMESKSESDPQKMINIYKINLDGYKYYSAQCTDFNKYVKLKMGSIEYYKYSNYYGEKISDKNCLVWENFTDKYTLIDEDTALQHSYESKTYFKHCFIYDLILNQILHDFAANKYGVYMVEDYLYPKAYIKVIKQKG